MRVEKVEEVPRYSAVISKVANTDGRNGYKAVMGQSAGYDTIITGSL